MDTQILTFSNRVAMEVLKWAKEHSLKYEFFHFATSLYKMTFVPEEQQSKIFQHSEHKTELSEKFISTEKSFPQLNQETQKYKTL